MRVLIETISVYPDFTRVGDLKNHLSDCPYICEDDKGRIAFVDDEAKRKFIEAKRNKALKRAKPKEGKK